MEQLTHLRIDPELVGVVTELDVERAVATLDASEEMSADERGLIHGGFTFGLADYAAMVAVNDPNVVLGGANVKFISPVTVGQTMVAEAWVTSTEGKKKVVEVVVRVAGDKVMEGTLTTFVLGKHILDT